MQNDKLIFFFASFAIKMRNVGVFYERAPYTTFLKLYVEKFLLWEKLILLKINEFLKKL